MDSVSSEVELSNAEYCLPEEPVAEETIVESTVEVCDHYEPILAGTEDDNVTVLFHDDEFSVVLEGSFGKTD